MDMTLSPASCDVCMALEGPEPDPIVYPAPRDAAELRSQDSVRGLLVGGAIGDAFGALVHAHTELPTSEPEPLGLRVGGATQFGLFTAEGALRMVGRANERGIGPSWDMLGDGVDRCLFARGDVRAAHDKFARDRSWAGWLVRQHALHTARGDFEATVVARRSNRQATLDEHEHQVHRRRNGSDGAGALVRSAAVGALVPLDWAFRTGVWSGIMTHGGTSGFLAPAALARIVAGVLSGESLETAVSNADIETRPWPGSEPVLQALRAGRDGTDIATGLPSAARALGQGIAAANGSDGFVETLRRCALDHGTAAAVVAGQLLGVTRGASALTSEWAAALDVVGPLDEMGEAIALGHRYWVLGQHYDEIDQADPDADSPLTGWLWSRFPGW